MNTNCLIIFFASIVLCQSIKFEEYEEIQLDTVRSCGSAPDTWRCCVTIKHYDATACAELDILRKDIGIRVTITFNNNIVYQNELSVANPPLICFKIPYTKGIAEACIKFYDMVIDRPLHRVLGCARFYGVFLHKKILKVPLGCFKIPISAEEMKLLEKKYNVESSENITIQVIM